MHVKLFKHMQTGPSSTPKAPPPSTVGPNNSATAGDDFFDDEDGEEEDELAAVMARLARARPPPEVARAAVKECKRLRQMGACVKWGAEVFRVFLVFV